METERKPIKVYVAVKADFAENGKRFPGRLPGKMERNMKLIGYWTSGKLRL